MTPPVPTYLTTASGVVEVLQVGVAGPPLLLLHGSAAGARPFTKFAELLAADCRIFIPNLAGYGASRHADPQLPPLEQHLALIESVLALETQQTWRVVGHSMGGFLALQATLRWPQRISSVVAIEPIAFGVLDNVLDAAALAEDRAVVTTLDQAVRTGRPAEGLEAFIGYWNGTPWSQLSEKMQQLFLGLSQQIRAEVLALSYDTTPAAAYTALQQPVLLILGAQAPLPARRIGMRLQGSLPRGHCAMIPEAGHMGPLTHPQGYTAIIDSFLRTPGL